MNTRKARAIISIGANTKEMDRELAAARKRLRNFAAGARKLGGKAIGGAQKVGGGLLGGLGFAGAFGLGEIVGDLRDFEKDLSRLGIEAEIPRNKMDELRKSIRDVSRATAINSTDIVNAGRTYFGLTSDVAGMADAMKTFARAAQATGSNVEEITALGAAMKKAGVNADQLESAFGIMIAQGRAGKITLGEQAREFVSLIPKFQKFGAEKGVNSLIQMNAAFQTIAEDFGSSSQAATGFENMMAMIQARQKQLAGAGVKIYDKRDGRLQLRDLTAIVDDIDKKLKDPRRMGAVLGENQEGRSALDALIRMRGKLNEVRDAAADAGGVVENDLNRALTDDAGRIEVAMNNLKVSMAEAFTPERIKEFTGAIVELAAAIGPVAKMVGFIGDVLGGFKKAGSDIRGYVTGEGHITTMDTVRAMAGDEQATAKIENLKAASRYTAIRAADSPLARQKLGINDAGSSLELARQYANAEGKGAAAKRAAAAKYFKESGQQADPWESTTGADTGAPSAPMNEETLRSLLGELRKQTLMMAQRLTVNLDGAKVGKGVDNSSYQRGAKKY